MKNYNEKMLIDIAAIDPMRWRYNREVQAELRNLKELFKRKNLILRKSDEKRQIEKWKKMTLMKIRQSKKAFDFLNPLNNFYSQDLPSKYWNDFLELVPVLEQGKNLYICGKFRSGKTTLAVKLAQIAIVNFWKFGFFYFPSSYFNQFLTKEQKATLNHLIFQSGNLLMIDDPFEETGKEIMKQNKPFIANLLDSRNQVIIATNFDIDGKHIWGKRIQNRIKDSFYIYQMEGKK